MPVIPAYKNPSNSALPSAPCIFDYTYQGRFNPFKSPITVNNKLAWARNQWMPYWMVTQWIDTWVSQREVNRTRLARTPAPYENENYNQNNQLRSINNQTLKKCGQDVAFFVVKRNLKTSLSKKKTQDTLRKSLTARMDISLEKPFWARRRK